MILGPWSSILSFDGTWLCPRAACNVRFRGTRTKNQELRRILQDVDSGHYSDSAIFLGFLDPLDNGSGALLQQPNQVGNLSHSLEPNVTCRSEQWSHISVSEALVIAVRPFRTFGIATLEVS